VHKLIILALISGCVSAPIKRAKPIQVNIYEKMKQERIKCIFQLMREFAPLIKLKDADNVCREETKR
jgi:hypothetical protein